MLKGIDILKAGWSQVANEYVVFNNFDLSCSLSGKESKWLMGNSRAYL